MRGRRQPCCFAFWRDLPYLLIDDGQKLLIKVKYIIIKGRYSCNHNIVSFMIYKPRKCFMRKSIQNLREAAFSQLNKRRSSTYLSTISSAAIFLQADLAGSSIFGVIFAISLPARNSEIIITGTHIFFDTFSF